MLPKDFTSYPDSSLLPASKQKAAGFASGGPINYVTFRLYDAARLRQQRFGFGDGLGAVHPADQRA